MRTILALLTIAFLSVSTFAVAKEGKKEGNGPCKAYHETCKNDPSVTGAADKKLAHKAMKDCVTAAATADTANGQACLDAHKSHKSHKKD